MEGMVTGAVVAYGKVISQLKLQKLEAEKVLADGPDDYFQGMVDVLTMNIEGLQRAQADLTVTLLAGDPPPPPPPPQRWNVLGWLSQLPRK